MKLHEELGCYGYYGFGGGVLMVRRKQQRPQDPGGELYCSSRCPIAQECWELHRERQRRLLPTLTATFDVIAERHRGDPKAMFDAWVSWILSKDPQAKTFGEPYLGGLGANLEDGIAVGSGGVPQYRGRLQLPWPLVPIEEWLEAHPRDPEYDEFTAAAVEEFADG